MTHEITRRAKREKTRKEGQRGGGKLASRGEGRERKATTVRMQIRLGNLQVEVMLGMGRGRGGRQRTNEKIGHEACIVLAMLAPIFTSKHNTDLVTCKTLVAGVGLVGWGGWWWWICVNWCFKKDVHPETLR